MMMKKRKFGMGGSMGIMKMAPTNPILFMNSFPPFCETSIVNQNTTMIPLSTGHVSLTANQPTTGSQFAIIVNVLIYAPDQQVDPMAVIDTIVNGSGVPVSRVYRPAFQFGFGENQNAYQQGMFYISNIPPLTGDFIITVKHPACKRRIVTIDQFINVAVNPLDRQTSQQTINPGTIQITSGLTGSSMQPFELIYGSIAIGRDFAQFTEPQQGFIPIQSVGSNIDEFDATLKTYYQLSATQGQFGISGLVSGDATSGSSSSGSSNEFVWSAAVQTFKAASGISGQPQPQL